MVVGRHLRSSQTINHTQEIYTQNCLYDQYIDRCIRKPVNCLRLLVDGARVQI